MQPELSPRDAETLRIVADFDVDPGGDTALCAAFEVAAGHTEAELHVVHVCAALAPAELQALSARVWGCVERALAERSWPEEIRVVTHIRRGEPAAVLRRVAAECQADLVITRRP